LGSDLIRQLRSATKDELKNATGFRFDKDKGLWTLGSK